MQLHLNDALSNDGLRSRYLWPYGSSLPLLFSCRRRLLSSGLYPWWPRTEKKSPPSLISHSQRSTTLDVLCMQIRWRERERGTELVICTFFLCSFCRSLNSSILLSSSFRSPESWMCRFPTFSISGLENKHTKTLNLKTEPLHDADKERKARNESWAYVLSSHRKILLRCCENKSNTLQR